LPSLNLTNGDLDRRHKEKTMQLAIRGITTDEVRRIQQGGGDANGQPALTRAAEGLANPCRHCLELIAPGDDKLVLAYRPFATPQPYAETGPIFLHKRTCDRYESDAMPSWFDFMEPAIIRGYDGDDWIRYDTGDVVAGKDLASAARRILADPTIAYVHIRSKYNCFQCRVERT
jgi:Protein of unknown function (DUF1203)